MDLDIWPRKEALFPEVKRETLGRWESLLQQLLPLKKLQTLICGIGGGWMVRMFLRRDGPADDGRDVGKKQRGPSQGC